MIEIRFTLNGASASARVLPAAPALEVLRNVFGLAGAKPGCGEGECGACTRPARSSAVSARPA